nr:MAG TPA: hypothetical protein [Caudoviricetes sp.]
MVRSLLRLRLRPLRWMIQLRPVRTRVRTSRWSMLPLS